MSELELPDNVEKSRNRLPDIVDFKPTGTNVLIEVVNEEEMLPESSIELLGAAKSEMTEGFGAPQAYILDVGPTVDPEEWGFKVGDRIAFSDRMTPLPPVAVSHDTPETLDVKGAPKRARGLIMPNGIKAVLVEREEESKQQGCCGGGCCHEPVEEDEEE